MNQFLREFCMLCWPFWLAGVGIVCVMVSEAMEANRYERERKEEGRRK